jgi:hypothetical protein
LRGPTQMQHLIGLLNGKRKNNVGKFGEVCLRKFCARIPLGKIDAMWWRLHQGVLEVVLTTTVEESSLIIYHAFIMAFE